MLVLVLAESSVSYPTLFAKVRLPKLTIIIQQLLSMNNIINIYPLAKIACPVVMTMLMKSAKNTFWPNISCFHNSLNSANTNANPNVYTYMYSVY